MTLTFPPSLAANDIAAPTLAARPVPAQGLEDAARAFEALFLASMLREAGFGRAREGLGGGIGEEQFASLLVSAKADALAAAGGFGLAASIVEALSVRRDVR